MKITIEKAKLENLKDILKLNQLLCEKEHKEYDKTINKNYPLTKEGKKYFKERITKDDGFAIVAIVNEKIVGYLVGALSKTEDYRYKIKMAEVENTFVLKDFRKKGIGGRLFNEFSKWCKNKKVNRIRAVISSHNNVSISFHKRKGFKDYDIVLEKK
jgi:L-amino acid N-acyltransferase YncA